MTSSQPQGAHPPDDSSHRAASASFNAKQTCGDPRFRCFFCFWSRCYRCIGSGPREPAPAQSSQQHCPVFINQRTTGQYSKYRRQQGKPGIARKAARRHDEQVSKGSSLMRSNAQGRRRRETEEQSGMARDCEHPIDPRRSWDPKGPQMGSAQRIARRSLTVEFESG